MSHRLFQLSFKPFAILFLLFPSLLAAQAHSLADYQDLLYKTTRFYGAQRSGSSDNWLISQYASPSPAPAACFTQDGISYQRGLDLSGGWHDAGDNIKFTLTIAWSAYALLKGYDAFPAAYADSYNRSYDSPNGIPDILDEVKWATDYLMKIHLDSATLVSQIGDYRDHNNGLTCPTMTKSGTAKGGDPRTVWFGATSNDPTQVKADVLGITSAALAAMGRLYAPYDASYATSAIRHARQLYAVAKSRTGTTAEPAGQNYYKDGSYLDDLSCAAAELHRATGEQNLLTEAINYSNQLGDHGWVVDWATHIDYCRHTIAASGTTGKEAVKNHWKKGVDRYRSKVSNNEYVKGLAFFSDWGSLRYAANAALSAALYHTAYNDPAASQFALSQLEWIAGANPYDRSFVVGWGNNPPQRPHHKNAFGKDEWFNSSSVPLYQLTGALVGGPHTNDYSDGSLTSPAGYQDIMTDYITNEVTIDYNSGLVGLVAYRVASWEGGLSSSSLSQSSSSTAHSSSGPVAIQVAPVERALRVVQEGGVVHLFNSTSQTLSLQAYSLLGQSVGQWKIAAGEELSLMPGDFGAVKAVVLLSSVPGSAPQSELLLRRD